MRIAHFIPCARGDLTDAVAESMVQTAIWMASNGHTRVRLQAHDPWLHMTRNRALQEAIAKECDLLLMQDADVSFADDVPALELLMDTLAAEGAAAVGAAVRKRAKVERYAVNPVMPNRTYEVTDIGTGLLLIAIKAVADIEPPWFGCELNASGTGVMADEGATFCRTLQAAGRKVCCDFTFPTRHLGRQTLDTARKIRRPNREHRASAHSTLTPSGSWADGDDCRKSEG